MPRFFVSPEQVKAGRVTITGPDVVHIVKVLRLEPGDTLTVLDGRGMVYEAVIEQAGRESVVCAVVSESNAGGAPALRITLVQGLPKNDKMDLIVQKATELGVCRLIPLICDRSVVKLAGDKPLCRLERWQRIAREAAKQCRRPDVPEVLPPAGWEEALAGMPDNTAAVIPWEEENQESLKKVLGVSGPWGDIYVFIGPEGGFTPAEVELARSHGVRPVTLGPRILRTETAGLAVLAIILYQCGDLGGKLDG
ncbi:Ribosomal RNA small subunit methyltransferase E [Pelotomaculum schinkii]|uniref:Ribosomal RNA small subunit methyltransferase E n=1 Tax=Pelotomaculum schinkii TaxID=78350 RepID=A0A4Y7RDX9_9FIRM|nr:16S rRNA (uracil(1498)-N(3))-methyltransferase [Pelotomaculum schinkii]TEB07225.1 Ribosomal RNA small subunit methyltransferase E [Pelotomaculum schinkii]